jgi:hypothetical protein
MSGAGSRIEIARVTGRYMSPRTQPALPPFLRGSGPGCFFVSREADEPVPVPEITKAIKHLETPDHIFWGGLQDEGMNQATA